MPKSGGVTCPSARSTSAKPVRSPTRPSCSRDSDRFLLDSPDRSKRDLKLTEYDDVMLSTFNAYERQTVYDQEIAVDYVITHVWRRESGRWRLAAAQAMVRAKDPPMLPVDANRLGDYAGTCELSGRRRYKVERRGDALVGGPENGELTALIPVGDNVLAEAGNPLGVLRIFVRGRDGVVEHMVQRRKFADLDWRRVPTSGPAEK